MIVNPFDAAGNFIPINITILIVEELQNIQCQKG